jgi:hypothetical protein
MSYIIIFLFIITIIFKRKNATRNRSSQHFFNENAMTSNDFGRNSQFFNEALMKRNELPVSLTDN